MNCKCCIHPDTCDCLCDTCILAKIQDKLPMHVYEMSDYTRKQWIYNQFRLLTGRYPKE